MKPDVSIIIPVYNTGKYLEDCLESVLNQTHYNIEVICINDGSTDNSLEVLQSYQKKDKRIKVFNQKNLGQSIARNNGILNANSEYLMFVDSDDTIDNDMIKTLYCKALKEKSDMVLSRFRVIDLKGNEIQESPAVADGISKEGLYRKSISIDIQPSICTCIFKKSLFELNNLTFKAGVYYEDLELHHKLIYFSNKVSIENKVFYNYYQRNISTTKTSKEKNILDVFIIFNEVIDFLISINKFNIYKNCISKQIYTLIKTIILRIETQRLDYLLTLVWNKLDILDKTIELTEIQRTHLYFLTLQATNNNFSFKEKVKSPNLFKDLKKYTNHKLGLSASIIDYLEVNQQIKNIYIYGGGDILISMLPFLFKLNMNILEIIDRNNLSISYNGRMFYSKKINEIELKDNDCILISSVSSLENIVEEIKIHTKENKIKLNIIGWNSYLNRTLN